MIPGVVVNLYDKVTGVLHQTTTTDSNGNYYFDVPADTEFSIKLDDSSNFAPGGPLFELSLTLLEWCRYHVPCI